MQRAATGLATVCLRLLGAAYGRRVVLLVGTGNNGGDALFAGAVLARRGARVTAVLLDAGPGARGRARRAPAGRRPGARRRVAGGAAASTGPTWSSTGCSASAAGAGCAPTPRRSPRRRRDGAGRAGRRRRAQRRRRRHRRRRRRRRSRRMHTVTFGAVKPGLVVGEGRGHAGRCTWSTSASARHLPPPTAVRSSPTPTSPRGWTRRRPATTSTRGASSASSPARRPIPAPACSAPGPRCAPGRAWSATPGRAADGGAGRLAGGDRHRRAAVRRRPGAGLGGRPRHGHGRRRAQRRWPRCWPPTCRWWWTPTRSPWPAAEPALVRGRSGADRADPARPGVRPVRVASVGAGPGRRGPRGWPPTSAASCCSRATRRSSPTRDGDGVRERDRHAVAGHRRHRRRARRHPRRAAGDRPAGATEAAAARRHLHGRAGSSPPSAGPLVAGDLVRRLPDAIGRVRGVPARRLGDSGA